MAPSASQIVLIAALAHDRVIGCANRLPWHLPADLAHFKRHTLDKPIVMGRRTWDSLPGRLPRRRHIVVSADPAFAPDAVEVARSPSEAVQIAGPVPEIMVVGGASLYQAFLADADRMLLTLIDAEIAGDARFPAWSPSQWRETAREHRPRDAANPYDLDFVTLVRRRDPVDRAVSDPSDES
jgi:dihydrofolate reductase